MNAAVAAFAGPPYPSACCLPTILPSVPASLTPNRALAEKLGGFSWVTGRRSGRPQIYGGMLPMRTDGRRTNKQILWTHPSGLIQASSTSSGENRGLSIPGFAFAPVFLGGYAATYVFRVFRSSASPRNGIIRVVCEIIRGMMNSRRVSRAFRGPSWNPRQTRECFPRKKVSMIFEFDPETRVGLPGWWQIAKH